MFDWLTGLVSASPLTYLVVLGLTVADVVGLLPAEAVVTTATLLAMEGRLLLVGVGLASVTGVALGDTMLYVLGRRLGTRLASRLFRSNAARERLRWARRQVSRRGAVIIIVGRWLPMGRTVTIFAAGTLDLPWRRFAIGDAVAITLWAGYYIGVTAFLGQALTGNTWLPLVLSLAIAAVVGAIAEGVRRYYAGRNPPESSDDSGPAPGRSPPDGIS